MWSSSTKRVLYIGGFALPDKNAAAQRVIGIGYSLRELGFDVVFLNSLKNSTKPESIRSYYGFQVIEYGREKEYDYLFSGTSTIKRINEIKPFCVIAYNYPAVALNQIRKYCKNNRIKCICDVTEWYGSSFFSLQGIARKMDTCYRMRVVHKKVDGIIAISCFLSEYYAKAVNTVLIPPTVDVNDSKWQYSPDNRDIVSYVYAGSPSSKKERLIEVVNAIEQMPPHYSLALIIVGITEKQFREMYHFKKKISERVSFQGRVSHGEAIRIIKSSNWSIIIRDNNSVVRAGFPTKLVESITCGTPVIINSFSNVCDYLSAENSILLGKISELPDAIANSYNLKKDFDTTSFDFHNYTSELAKLFD